MRAHAYTHAHTHEQKMEICIHARERSAQQRSAKARARTRARPNPSPQIDRNPMGVCVCACFVKSRWYSSYKYTHHSHSLTHSLTLTRLTHTIPHCTRYSRVRFAECMNTHTQFDLLPGRRLSRTTPCPYPSRPFPSTIVKFVFFCWSDQNNSTHRVQYTNTVNV